MTRVLQVLKRQNNNLPTHWQNNIREFTTIDKTASIHVLETKVKDLFMHGREIIQTKRIIAPT